jgi:hypothetical protein
MRNTVWDGVLEKHRNIVLDGVLELIEDSSIGLQFTQPWRGKGDHKDRPYKNGVGAILVFALHQHPNHRARLQHQISSLEGHA